MPSSGVIQRGSAQAALFVVCLFGVATPALAAVHAGDQLQINIYNDPELSRKVVVNGAGIVSIPLAGNVNVAGLETSAVAERIERALNPYFKSPAAVGVELTGQTTSLFVSGGPGGVLKYEPGETLTSALSDLGAGVGSSPVGDKSSTSRPTGLGGLEHSRIDLRRVTVDRNGSALGTFDALDLSSRGQSGPELQPGDTISLVDKPNVVKVLGDVATPGDTHVSARESLNDALTQAGGVRLTAASANLTLERGGTTKTLALGDAMLSQPAQDGDVLTVPTAPRVSVAGLVGKPGMYPLTTNFTLVNALYQAGGPVKFADLSHVQVVHAGTATTYNVADIAHGNLSQNPALTDGDLVFVPEGHKIDFSSVFQILLPILYLIPHP